MVRVGILGAADRHVDGYVGALRNAGAEVVGLFDHDSERGSQRGRFNGVPSVRTAESLVVQADGVLICAETAHHRVMIELASEAGVAILCEGPLGVDEEDSRLVVDLCGQRGVTLMPALPLRFDHAVQRIREMVANGELGTVRALSGVDQSVMPQGKRSESVDPLGAVGPAMVEQVVHLADAYSWIIGEEPEEVYAVGNRIVRSESSTSKTSGLVMVSYPDGVFGSIDCSWNRPLAYPAEGGLALSVVCDGGTADAEPMRQRLTQFGGARNYSWIEWRISPRLLMIREFLECVSEERTPGVSAGEGLRATRVALAAQESLDSGAPVSLLAR